jgi:hypothetical protein
MVTRSILSVSPMMCALACALSIGCGRSEEAPPIAKAGPRVIQAKEPLGNCFEHSFKFVALMHSDDPDGETYRQQFRSAGLDPKDAKLVHGIPTHRDEGLRYPHAWVELGELAIDVTQAVHAPVYLGTKARYYQLGQIRPHECRHYTHTEAADEARRTGHRGPWITLPDDAVVHVPSE